MSGGSRSVTVFTAIAGAKDMLREDFPNPDGAKFIAYVDEPRSSPMWDVRRLPDVFKDPIRNARMVKILSQHYADRSYTIWLDANISFDARPIEIVRHFIPEETSWSAGAFEHFARRSPSEEALECIRCGKDDRDVLYNQVSSLEGRGLLCGIAKVGFWETGVLVRVSCPDVSARNERWFAEMSAGSRRDQITFPVCFGGACRSVRGNVRQSSLFHYRHHD